MLLGIFLTVSALSAAGICFGADAFDSLQWIWILPVSFAGTFLALVLVLFLVLLVMSALVKMDEPQETDSPFYRAVIMELVKFLIPILRVRLHMQGLEQTPKDGRFLLVCNHLYDIDPVVLMMGFPKSQLAFISKRENDAKFLVGPFLHKIMCQAINRENDREALKTILNCIDIIKQDKASIGVFPEGYIYDDRLLHPFRYGVFKIALRTKVPVVVCTLRNTHMLMSNIKKLKPTDIHMHLVGVVQPEEMDGMTAVQLGERVHRMMAEDLGSDLVLQL